MESIRTNQCGQFMAKSLMVSEDMICNLQKRTSGITRAGIETNVAASVKCCPTRHGCTGATNCDCSLSDYNYGR